MQKITSCLWFDNQAEEAIHFYTDIFKDGKVTNISRYGEGAPLPAGTILTATFELHGQEFMVLNGGPHFAFSPAISFFVRCETQAEIDELWEKLSDGGATEMCGWLKDRYGVSWQIVPTILGELLQGGDAAQSQRVMDAVLQMEKLDIATLRRAYEGA
jgi:predicted 3-demethylubiquinone-9 3-methyltransferase (glyoxalase superfamily)